MAAAPAARKPSTADARREQGIADGSGMEADVARSPSTDMRRLHEVGTGVRVSEDTRSESITLQRVVAGSRTEGRLARQQETCDACTRENANACKARVRSCTCGSDERRYSTNGVGSACVPPVLYTRSPCHLLCHSPQFCLYSDDRLHAHALWARTTICFNNRFSWHYRRQARPPQVRCALESSCRSRTTVTVTSPKSWVCRTFFRTGAHPAALDTEQRCPSAASGSDRPRVAHRDPRRASASDRRARPSVEDRAFEPAPLPRLAAPLAAICTCGAGVVMWNSHARGCSDRQTDCRGARLQPPPLPRRAAPQAAVNCGMALHRHDARTIGQPDNRRCRRARPSAEARACESAPLLAPCDPAAASCGFWPVQLPRHMYFEKTEKTFRKFESQRHAVRQGPHCFRAAPRRRPTQAAAQNSTSGHKFD